MARVLSADYTYGVSGMHRTTDWPGGQLTASAVSAIDGPILVIFVLSLLS